jgi:hypothetical protein
MSGTVALLISAGAVLAAQNPIVGSPVWGDAIEEYIVRFVGPDPLDCGSFSNRSSQQQRRQTMDCALAAAGRHQRFQTSVDLIDPQGGLLGDANGIIYNFQAFPCRAGNCPPEFSIRRCPSPRLDGRFLVCGEPDTPVPTQRPDEYVHILTGPSPLDCGQHAIPATEVALRKSIACATETAQRSQAFQAMKQLQGTDSRVYSGLVGDASGRIYVFNYDSSPCGNPGCYGRLTLSQCASPTVSATPMRFECSQ